MALDSLVKKIKTKLKNNDDIILNINRSYNFISTGSILLDNILGGGLLVQGRVTEVFGLESCGKSTIALQSCANALKQNLNVLYFDFEQTFDIKYGEALGVDIKNKNFLVIQPNNLEECKTILAEAEKEADLNNAVIVIDSIAAAKPQELIDKAGEQQRIGLHAQRIGEFATYLQSVWCGKKNAYVLCINQVRRVPSSGGSLYQSKAFKDQGIGFGNFDSSFTTTGGQQLRYVCSIRLSLDFAGKVEDGSFDDGDLVRTGNFIKAFSVKNKIRPPFQTAKLAIVYGKGTDDTYAIIETLKQHGYIKNAGAWLHYTDSNKSELGSGLSFKANGKKEFNKILKETRYVEDMKKTYLSLMNSVEAVEIADTDDDI